MERLGAELGRAGKGSSYIYTKCSASSLALNASHGFVIGDRQVGRDIFRDREPLSTVKLLTRMIRRGQTRANDHVSIVIHLRTKPEAPSTCLTGTWQTFIQDDHHLGPGTPLAILFHCGVRPQIHHRGTSTGSCADKTWRPRESGHCLGSRLHIVATD